MFLERLFFNDLKSPIFLFFILVGAWFGWVGVGCDVGSGDGV
jgi:hypothetical protein